MNFYPIYKSKLEPWIKWWILKGNKIAPKVLSEVIEGTTPITIEGVYKGTSLQELLFKGQTIQEGTPSPEAPIPVQTVKEDNTITINEDSFKVDLGGKNLLNLNATQTKSGVTCTNNGDGSITLNGTATANMDLWIANGTSANVIVKSMPNGTALTQRINVKSGSYTGTAYFETVTYNGSTNNYTNLRGDITYTFTYNGWIKPTEIYIANGSVFNNWTIQPQLEHGTQATEYSPYTANPIELCKIGNYQDKLYYDNGKWYIEKKIGKVVLNGSETWGSTNLTTGKSYYYINNNIGLPLTNSNGNDIISNYFVGVPYSTYYQVGGVNGITHQYYNSNCYLRIFFIEAFTDIDAYKTWLSNNNTTVYYALAEATTSEITDTTLISQLEAIKNASLISGTNEITQTPSDLPFILNFKYYMKG